MIPQVAVPAPPASVHVWVDEPPGPAVFTVTFPVGVSAAPGLVSLTVMVHEIGLPCLNGGVQTTPAETLRFSTVRWKIPELAGWLMSPEYAAVRVGAPSDPGLGVYVTEQVPPTSAQVAALNNPAPLDEKVTLPFGVRGVPRRVVSLTTTVQVVFWLTASGSGAQLNVVESARCAAESVIV